MRFGGIPSLGLLQFLYQNLDDQLCQSDLEPSKPVSPDSDVDEALDKLDEKEFLQFEVRFGLVYGRQYDLAAQNPSSNAEIELDVEKQLQYFEQRIQPPEAPVKSPPLERRCSGSFEDLSVQTHQLESHEAAYNYAERVVKNSSSGEEFDRSFLPTTLKQWLSAVRRFTNFNKLVEWQYAKETSDVSYECQYSNEAEQQRNRVAETRAELLYELLMQRPSCKDREHRALLLLSGFAQSSTSSKVTFDMLLSLCSDTEPQVLGHEWQETICSLELCEQGHDHTAPVKICSVVRTSHFHRLPLHLSFDNSHLWVNRGSRKRSRKPSMQSPKAISLGKLLKGSHLESENLENRVKMFRLSLRLACSLHQLYSGPWLQENWSAELVRFLSYQEPGGRKIAKLDEPYIPCVFNKDWRNINKLFKKSRQYVETCPDFFLSFAQLLVDIAKGEPGNRPTGETSLAWYQSLLSEINDNFQDEVLKWYGRAIQGCLQYSIDFKGEDDRIEDRIEDPRVRAQAVIYENIVLHLQRNLNIWEQKRDEESCFVNLVEAEVSNEAIERCDKPSRYGTVPQAIPGSRGSLGSLKSSVAASQTTYELVDPNEFTLFSDDDDNYEKKKDTGALHNSFTTDLAKHAINYLHTLSKTTTSQKIRIAVLDTGLRIDEDDTLLYGGRERVTRRKNFINPQSMDCTDRHGHGTHVTRILLRFAPRAEVIVGKISEGKSLGNTTVKQLVEALEWAGEHADIINLSFGLGRLGLPITPVQKTIMSLKMKGKLIFAAASNSGANRPRAFPANAHGVFAIHATNDKGDKAPGMNPAPMDLRLGDNFATLGVRIDSLWKGEEVYISGTSFATGIAVAIAANALEYINHKLTGKYDKPDNFLRYGGMRNLFKAMATNSDGYEYLAPWKVGLWDGYSDVFENLRAMAIDM